MNNISAAPEEIADSESNKNTASNPTLATKVSSPLMSRFSLTSSRPAPVSVTPPTSVPRTSSVSSPVNKASPNNLPSPPPSSQATTSGVRNSTAKPLEPPQPPSSFFSRASFSGRSATSSPAKSETSERDRTTSFGIAPSPVHRDSIVTPPKDTSIAQSRVTPATPGALRRSSIGTLTINRVLVMVPHCPGLVVKVRPAPNSQDPHCNLIKSEQPVEVYSQRVHGYYQLVDGSVS